MTIFLNYLKYHFAISIFFCGVFEILVKLRLYLDLIKYQTMGKKLLKKILA